MTKPLIEQKGIDNLTAEEVNSEARRLTDDCVYFQYPTGAISAECLAEAQGWLMKLMRKRGEDLTEDTKNYIKGLAFDSSPAYYYDNKEEHNRR